MQQMQAKQLICCDGCVMRWVYVRLRSITASFQLVTDCS